MKWLARQMAIDGQADAFGEAPAPAPPLRSEPPPPGVEADGWARAQRFRC